MYVRQVAHCQEQGVFLNGRRIQPNKPTHIKDGYRIRLGDLDQTYLIHCETVGKPYLYVI